jgi:hypothetical protein
MTQCTSATVLPEGVEPPLQWASDAPRPRRPVCRHSSPSEGCLARSCPPVPCDWNHEAATA